MTMRTMRRRLDTDAVYRAAIKGNDKKHQRKFMSRMEKWGHDLREAIKNQKVLQANP